MPHVGSYEMKTHLARLLDRVSQGEEFTITKRGVPVARLVPIDGAKKADIAEAIKELKKLARKNTLNGLSVREMIEEGRR